MSSEESFHKGFPTQRQCLGRILCLQRLIEVGRTCTEVEDSERCFCGATAGRAEWWHREGRCGGGEGEDAKGPRELLFISLVRRDMWSGMQTLVETR